MSKEPTNNETLFERDEFQYPYTMVPNYLLEDKRIKGNALHILIYLLSKPSKWVAVPKDIQKRTGFARSAYDTAIKKLESAGYLHKTVTRSKKTGFNKTNIRIYPDPKRNPHYNGELPDYECYLRKKDLPPTNDKSDNNKNTSTTSNNINQKTENTSKIYKNYEDNCDNFEFGNTDDFYFED